LDDRRCISLGLRRVKSVAMALCLAAAKGQDSLTSAPRLRDEPMTSTGSLSAFLRNSFVPV
jgi:hypothetical protein